MRTADRERHRRERGGDPVVRDRGRPAVALFCPNAGSPRPVAFGFVSPTRRVTGARASRPLGARKERAARPRSRRADGFVLPKRRSPTAWLCFGKLCFGKMPGRVPPPEPQPAPDATQATVARRAFRLPAAAPERSRGLPEPQAPHRTPGWRLCGATRRGARSDPARRACGCGPQGSGRTSAALAAASGWRRAYRAEPGRRAAAGRRHGPTARCERSPRGDRYLGSASARSIRPWRARRTRSKSIWASATRRAR
jgi:hypothetical protein